MICAIPFMMLVPPLPGQTLSAEDIMCRVAENQRHAEQARREYVYDMNVFVRLKRANGKAAREETRDYVVAPGVKGPQRRLVKLEGKIVEGKTEIPYTKAGFEHKKADIDAVLTDSFAGSIMWRKHSMGVWVDWFPLAQTGQSRYEFTLRGEERYRDYDVYRISFQELKNEAGDDDCWSGEALIDRREFQPVSITTQWSCKIPRAATIMLGISVSQIGAKVNYERFAGDAWFPVSSGGELKVRALFLYARTIAFSAKNSGFRRTDVKTAIDYGEAAEPEDGGSPQ